MIQKIKRYMYLMIASSTLLAPAVATGFVATASANNITSNICKGANEAADGNNSSATPTTCGTAGTNGSTNLADIASNVVNVFSLIVGVIAIIMIIYGGFKYITSGGDSGNVSGAKNTLIYAIVGLIIVALAQFLVHFVLNTTTNAVPGSS